MFYLVHLGFQFIKFVTLTSLDLIKLDRNLYNNS